MIWIENDQFLGILLPSVNQLQNHTKALIRFVHRASWDTLSYRFTLDDLLFQGFASFYRPKL